MDRAVSHLLPPNPRTDPDIQADCEDVLDAALAWSRDELPLNELMRLGTIADHHGRPSPRYSRWVAMCTARRNDPRRRALLAALDVVVVAQAVVTHQGLFSVDEVHSHDHAVRFVKAHERAPWEREAA